MSKPQRLRTHPLQDGLSKGVRRTELSFCQVGVHNWELKYGFSLLGGVQYAANLWYKIAANGGTVEYTIQVYSTTNESSCKVTPANAGRCTAAGTKLTFHNH